MISRFLQFKSLIVIENGDLSLGRENSELIRVFLIR